MELISRDAVDYVIQGHSLVDLGNYQEQAVLEVLREVYDAENPPCRCILCVEDIYALSLNSLPPRYIQSTSLRSYQSSSSFISLEAVREKVLAAVAKVRAKPNH